MFPSQFDPVNWEEEQLALWDEEGTFEKSTLQNEAKGGSHFVFQEGPPTANGKPGLHHVLACEGSGMSLENNGGQSRCPESGMGLPRTASEAGGRKGIGAESYRRSGEARCIQVQQFVQRECMEVRERLGALDKAHGLLGGYGEQVRHTYLTWNTWNHGCSGSDGGIDVAVPPSACRGMHSLPTDVGAGDMFRKIVKKLCDINKLN